MKNVLKTFGIIALAAIMTFALVFTGCPDNNSDDDSDDNNGSNNNGSNNNPGGVTSAQNVQVYNKNGTPYTGSGKVIMYGISFEMEEEVGNITNGKLSFTLPDISASIANKGDTFADWFIYSYTDNLGFLKSIPNVSPADAKNLASGGFGVSLANNDEGELSYYSVSTDQAVWYIYSDKACTISGVYSTTEPSTHTRNRIETWSCSFNKGWNTVYQTFSYNENTNTSISTVSTSPIGNATDWKWIIFIYNDSDDNDGPPPPPPDPTNNSGGTFTVTGIPAQYNGKYAVFEGGTEDLPLIGCQSYNATTRTFTLVQIANGSVSLPMWIWNYGEQMVRYSGNGIVEGEFVIFNTATDPEEPVAVVEWSSITFSNGSVTKTWSSGTPID